MVADDKEENMLTMRVLDLLDMLLSFGFYAEKASLLPVTDCALDLLNGMVDFPTLESVRY